MNDGINPLPGSDVFGDRHRQEALTEKTESAVLLLRTAVSAHAPAVFANSLGAEDMVLTDLIAREKLDIGIFSIDTGRLPPETHDLLHAAGRHYGLAIRLYAPRHDLLEAHVNASGVNSFYHSVALRKACCHVRKVEPLQRALAGKKSWVTGLRAQQALTRAGLPARHYDVANGLEKFNPLHDWGENDVWDYIRSRKVPYNRLHDRNFPSIGCAPCTRAVAQGEDIRAGRWWWEDPQNKECGLHQETG